MIITILLREWSSYCRCGNLNEKREAGVLSWLMQRELETVVTTAHYAAKNMSLHRKVKELLAKEMGRFVASASHFATQNMSLHRKVKNFFIQIQ